MIAALSGWLLASPIARVALAILLFLLSFSRVGERTGRLAERLENSKRSQEITGGSA